MPGAKEDPEGVVYEDVSHGVFDPAEAERYRLEDELTDDPVMVEKQRAQKAFAMLEQKKAQQAFADARA